MRAPPSISLTLSLRLLLVGWLSVGLHAAPGDVDTGFNPNANSSVYSTAVQTDGKVILGGYFNTIGGTPRNNVARLNADGSLDTAFDPNASSYIYCTAVQIDGKIILGGSFTTVGGTTRNYVARLNADGNLDTTFNPTVGGSSPTVYAAAVQTDGKIILGGSFTTVGGVTRNNVARLNPDGSLDTGFNPNTDGSVYSTAVQTDGKIILGGAFDTVGGTSRMSVARLNADGSLDTSFNSGFFIDVYSTAVQADGKILLSSAISFVRLNVDGSQDTTFNPSVSGSFKTVYCTTVQADGKILLGGSFSTVSGTARNDSARLNADGSVDTTFNPNVSGSSGYVFSTGVQADGKVLLSGSFTTVGSAARNNAARLVNDNATQNLTIPSTDRVQWLRGGTSPETQQVNFERSVDGGTTYTQLGVGTRITGGWECTGLNLSGSGLVRARARVSGGNYNGSSGLVETVAAYTFSNLAPDIAVQQPAGTELSDGGATVDFGEAAIGTSGTVNTFTVINSGSSNLTLGAITKDGTGAGDFVVNTTSTNTTIASGSSTTFRVTFAPGGTVSGTRNAAIHIANNVGGSKNPFDIALAGLGLSSTTSTGNDGLNDHAKYQLSALGFDYTKYQPVLVQTLYSGANSAGLYTTAQVQAVNVGTPLIQRDASSGQFKLTIAVLQSADLKTFSPLSLSTGTTSFNAAGALEFRFYSTSGAQFYRVQSQ